MCIRDRVCTLLLRHLVNWIERMLGYLWEHSSSTCVSWIWCQQLASWHNVPQFSLLILLLIYWQFCTPPSVKKIIASVDYDEERKPSFSLSSYQNQLIYPVNSDLYIVIVLSTVWTTVAWSQVEIDWNWAHVVIINPGPTLRLKIEPLRLTR